MLKYKMWGFFFLYQKKKTKQKEVSLHAVFEIRSAHCCIKGFLCFVLWLLVCRVVLTGLEMLILTGCSVGSRIKRCKAQA